MSVRRITVLCITASLVAMASAQTFTVAPEPGHTITTADGATHVAVDFDSYSSKSGGDWLFGSAIVPIAPFSGQFHEGFETDTQPNWPGGFEPCLPDGMFGPNQKVSTMCANLTHITGGWSFGCPMSPHGGSRLYGNTGGHNIITFNEAAGGRWGGYFGTNNPSDPDATIEFYDDCGELIDRRILRYANDCTWNWHGFRMNVEVKTIEIWGFRGTGGFVMMDDMEYTPEAGASCGQCDDACDMNCDTMINAFDIEPFLTLLFDPESDPCCGERGDIGSTGDTNGDGEINAFDIEGFLDCLFP